MSIQQRIARLAGLARRRGLLTATTPAQVKPSEESHAMARLREDPTMAPALATVEAALAGMEFEGRAGSPQRIRVAMRRLQGNPEAAAAMDLISKRLLASETPVP